MHIKKGTGISRHRSLRSSRRIIVTSAVKESGRMTGFILAIACGATKNVNPME